MRARRGRSLAEALLKSRSWGAPIKTSVTVAHETPRAVRLQARTRPGGRSYMTVSPDVATVLAGLETTLHTLEQRFGREIAIEANPSLDRVRFQITPV